MNNMMMWIVVVIALVVGAFGGYMYANAQASNEIMMVKQSMQKQLDEAKMTSDKMQQDDKMMQDEDAAMEPTGTTMEEKQDAMSGSDKMMPASQ